MLLRICVTAFNTGTWSSICGPSVAHADLRRPEGVKRQAMQPASTGVWSHLTSVMTPRQQSWSRSAMYQADGAMKAARSVKQAMTSGSCQEDAAIKAQRRRHNADVPQYQHLSSNTGMFRLAWAALSALHSSSWPPTFRLVQSA